MAKIGKASDLPTSENTKDVSISQAFVNLRQSFQKNQEMLNSQEAG